MQGSLFAFMLVYTLCVAEFVTLYYLHHKPAGQVVQGSSIWLHRLTSLYVNKYAGRGGEKNIKPGLKAILEPKKSFHSSGLFFRRVLSKSEKTHLIDEALSNSP